MNLSEQMLENNEPAPIVDVTPTETEVAMGDNAPSESASVSEPVAPAEVIPVVVDTTALKDEANATSKAFNEHLQTTQAYMQKITSNKDLKIHFIENGLETAAKDVESAIVNTYKLMAKSISDFAAKL